MINTVKTTLNTSLFCAFILASALIGCESSCKEQTKTNAASTRNRATTNTPNVVLIMVDDMGYECVGAYGSKQYSTPNIDKLATQGILFNHCISQPLCTPSRVKMMTGKYNYRNYAHFDYLPNNEYTFGNLMQDAGYKTCIVGKWQLNGLAFQESIADWDDNKRPNDFGFDEYCLWQLTKNRAEGGRYANPLIEQNGKIIDGREDEYGPDLFTNYMLDFMARNKNQPFFVYYPMVLPHAPFVPTPDSQNWRKKEQRYHSDTANFKDMVTYADKLVGRIMQQLDDLALAENTILIFTADNGTHTAIHSNLNNEIIQGAKGNTIDAGVHVPLIVRWPSKLKQDTVVNEIIGFNDFFPTLADVAGIEIHADGKSFYPLIANQPFSAREFVFVHYDPKWEDKFNQYRNQFAATKTYKLYQDGLYYNIAKDKLEKRPLKIDSLNERENLIREKLQAELNRHPTWK